MRPFKNFTINQDNSNLRLDKFLLASGLSFSVIPKLVRKKLIKVNNQKSDIYYRLCEGDEVAIYIDLDFKKKEKPLKKISKEFVSNIIQSIIYKDDSLIAINKKSGVAVQGGSGIDVSIDDALPYLKFDLKETPRLIHRLDKDTSGVLLVARNRKSADHMSMLFKEHKIEKTYLALVKGIPSQNSQIIKIPLLKKYKGGNEKVYKDDNNGKPSETLYKVLEVYEDQNLSLLEVIPKTGRTHQIRVHLKEIGYPIIGDFKYGLKNTNFKELELRKRLYLHAFSIEFEDSNKKKVFISTSKNNINKNLLRSFI